MKQCRRCGSGKRNCRCGFVQDGKEITSQLGFVEQYRMNQMLCPSEERKAELKAWKEQQKADKEFMEKFEETHGLLEDKKPSHIFLQYLKVSKSVRISGEDLIRYIKILKDKD